MESNVQKMRDALEMMCSLFDKGVICTSYANTPEEMDQIEKLYGKAKVALSAPPRNCDVGTPDEQRLRFYAFCDQRECEHCDLPNVGCRFAWMQMPYESEVKQ